MLNLGGSTGLAFFRPDTAHFEAANVQVYSNVFVGGQAAVAFVGSINVEVVNNTIYLPEKWVIRILQETVDPDRFVECGDNMFRNNIVVRNAGLSTETNIGPNTRPETFTFSNNLWFHTSNANWSGPSIPVPDVNGIVNQNPLLADPANFDVHLPPNSPAAGAGYPVNAPALDIYGQGFALPRSIGAAEANPVSGVTVARPDVGFAIYPNPFSTEYRLVVPESGDYRLTVYDATGRSMTGKPAASWPEGVYFFVLVDQKTGRRLVRGAVKGR